MTTLPEILKAAVEFNTTAAAYLDAEEKYRQAGVARDAAERAENEAGGEVRSLREPFEVARAKFVQLVGNRSAAGVLQAALAETCPAVVELAPLTADECAELKAKLKAHCNGHSFLGRPVSLVAGINFGSVPPTTTVLPPDEPKVTEPPKRGREFI